MSLLLKPTFSVGGIRDILVRIRMRIRNAVEIKVFSYYFCLVMEGYGSGSALVTKGSGCESGRPKKIRILWIRIPNTGHDVYITNKTHDKILEIKHMIKAYK
jgi:hypothetical protein